MRDPSPASPACSSAAWGMDAWLGAQNQALEKDAL